MSIAENLERVRAELPKDVTLVAVSKTKPIELIMEAYETGQRDFGENKVQELVEKHDALPKDIRWHMIGHLQTNKVKYIAPFVHLIHGVDSLKLLKEVNKRAKNAERIINVLLQVHIAEEETKFGFDKKRLYDLYTKDNFDIFENISLKGLMGMASFTDDLDQIQSEFLALFEIYSELKKEENDKFNILSMGMSEDYKIAVSQGSNMVRVGSKIFGARKK